MPKDNKFTILLDDDQNKNLEQMKKTKGLSKGQIIRDALRAYFAMELYNSPTCANGLRCFVPQMHNPTQPPRLPENGGTHAR